MMVPMIKYESAIALSGQRNNINRRRSSSVNRACVFIVFFLTSVGRAYASLPSDSQSAPRSTVEVQVSNNTLKVPKDYFDGFFGFKDRIYLRALLPCLLPKDDDRPEYKNTHGDRVKIQVMDGKSFPSDEKLLEIYLNDEKVNKIINEYDTDDGRFHVYKRWNTDEVFVQKTNKQKKLFFTCIRSPADAPWLGMPFPDCEVREHIWGDVLLVYRYDRKFQPRSIEIDRNIINLLDSFRDSETELKIITSGGECK